ncbi:hypothetical protein [Streptomyces indicus]|uniref:Uncharacterized protein n=1 Tax=Streptomyces indicus TaxID=417292 RepID=A0A1G9IQX3_9ACTN|nr:hypothetical protein [Streptomyces indicus]SDL27567.1 hypothetical protein SAMN05421806_12515 [Streptomyces indicus]
MTTSAHTDARRLADALSGAAVAAGETTPAVRGADWRLAEVDTVNADGTIETTDGIIVRRMESYVLPAAGDVIVISQSSSGNWIALGRTATNSGGWTALTLAAGYTNPGHGYTASYLREGRRIWLRGRIGPTSGTIADGDTILTLPAAIRPADSPTVSWAVTRDASAMPAVCRLEITTAGAVRTFQTTALPSWVALDGISYTI